MWNWKEILSELSTILANNRIGIFAVSTFNTDYILVKKENFERALKVLALEGYSIIWNAFFDCVSNNYGG